MIVDTWQTEKILRFNASKSSGYVLQAQSFLSREQDDWIHVWFWAKLISFIFVCNYGEDKIDAYTRR